MFAAYRRKKSGSGYSLMGYKKWQPSVIAPSPLRLSSSRIFLVAGYGTGGALLQVDKAGSKWTATVLDQYKADKGLSSEQQTPILYNDMIISVMPKDGGDYVVNWSVSRLRICIIQFGVPLRMNVLDLVLI